MLSVEVFPLYFDRSVSWSWNWLSLAFPSWTCTVRHGGMSRWVSLPRLIDWKPLTVTPISVPSTETSCHGTSFTGERKKKGWKFPFLYRVDVRSQMCGIWRHDTDVQIGSTSKNMATTNICPPSIRPRGTASAQRGTMAWSWAAALGPNSPQQLYRGQDLNRRQYGLITDLTCSA